MKALKPCEDHGLLPGTVQQSFDRLSSQARNGYFDKKKTKDKNGFFIGTVLKYNGFRPPEEIPKPRHADLEAQKPIVFETEEEKQRAEKIKQLANSLFKEMPKSDSSFEEMEMEH